MKKEYRASRKSPSVAASPSKRSLLVTLTDHSVIYQRGVLAKRAEEIPYTKINSVNVKQGIMERSLGYGDVIIMTGNDVNGIVLDNIEQPQGLKNDIMAMIQGAAAPASSPATPNQASNIDAVELKKLADLKSQGLITEEEYAAKKKQLLGL